MMKTRKKIQGLNVEHRLGKAKYQQGFALLFVITIISLLLVLVVELNSRVITHYMAIDGYFESKKAYTLAKSGIEIAKTSLKLDSWENDYDYMGDRWALLPKKITMQNYEGEIELWIEDEDRKLNINALMRNSIQNDIGQAEEKQPKTSKNFSSRPAQKTNEPLHQKQEQGASPGKSGKEEDVQTATDQKRSNRLHKILTRLFEVQDINRELADAVIDWLDPNLEPYEFGAENDYYQDLFNPYTARNGPISTLAELRLIKGVNHDVFNKLKKYITIYSEGLINANTTYPEILESLSWKISPFTAEDILAARSKNPFKSKGDLKKIPGLQDELVGEVLSYLGVQSNTFLIYSTGVYGNARETIECVLTRNKDSFIVKRSVWQ